MGLGIDLKLNGHNIVFTGGTGILVFLDVVAKMILTLSENHSTEGKNYNEPCVNGMNDGDDLIHSEKEFGPNFKLTIYYAAQKEEEAIGIELLRKFKEVQVKCSLENFDLKLRLSDSKEKQPRWDKAFLENELKLLSGKIGKIVVCGSPIMNETFDRAFEDKEFRELLKVDWKDIEIL